MNRLAKKLNSIKDTLSNLGDSLIKWSVADISVKLITIVTTRACHDAISVLPDPWLNEYKKVIIFVVRNLLDMPPEVKAKEIEEEYANLLRDKLLSRESVKNDMANYFLIVSFYNSFLNKDQTNQSLKEEENDALAKAKSYKESVEPISHTDLYGIYIKAQIKLIKNVWKSLRQPKKETFLVKIKPRHVFFVASAVSGLFLIGGYLYTRFLFYFLGVNTSDFFDISEYISSSVGVVFGAFIVATIGMYFYFTSAPDEFSKIISTNQHGIKPKNKILFLVFLAGLYVGIFFAKYKYYGTFSPTYFAVAILISFYYIAFKVLKIDKLIENKSVVRPVAFFVFSFLMYLGLNLFDILSDIKNGDYQSEYVILFAEGYEEYSDHKFFMANSKYAFLLDDKTKKAVVIPMSGIKAVQAKKSP